MAGTKLLRGHVSVYAFFPEATIDWKTVSAAALNDAIDAGLGYDISCAITDESMNINPTDSDTDDSISICDIGNVSTPTFFNYEVSFDTFRNGPAALGQTVAVYDIPPKLFPTADLPFYIVKRIGPAQGSEFDDTQEISVFGVRTDFPTDVLADGDNILFGSRFKPTGEINTNTRLVA